MSDGDLYLKKIEIDQTLVCEKQLNVDIYDLTILCVIKKIHQHEMYSNRIDFSGYIWYGMTLQQIMSFAPILPKKKVTYDKIKNLSENGLIYFHRDPDFPVGFFYRLRDFNPKDSELGRKTQKFI